MYGTVPNTHTGRQLYFDDGVYEGVVRDTVKKGQVNWPLQRAQSPALTNASESVTDVQKLDHYSLTHYCDYAHW